MKSLRRKVIINIIEDNHIKTIEMNNYKLLELQQRINKAIKYLKDREYDNMNCSVCSVMSDELLDILKGE